MSDIHRMGIGAGRDKVSPPLATFAPSRRFSGALLDRLTHYVHILEMNGESFRLATSKKSRRRSEQSAQARKHQPRDATTGA